MEWLSGCMLVINKPWKKGIISGFCHVASNKIYNLHVNCPTGKNSWFGYQRALANNEVDKFKHGPGLPTS